MSKDINATLESIKGYKDEIDWILAKQAELRAELMTFYKKDLKEIQSALNSMNASENDAASDFAKKALEDVQTHFLDHWKRSYDIITPDTPDSKAG